MDSKLQLKDRGLAPHLELFAVQLMFGTWPIVSKVALRSMSSTIAFGLAPLILGEAFNSRILIASLLIFAGVGVVARRGRSRAVKEVAEHPDAIAH